MSDFGLFEAATDAEQAPRRREMIAARQMSAALGEVHRQFEGFLSNADGADNFEDRFAMSRKDIARTMIAHGVGAYPAVMREVHGSLKSAWYNKQSERDMEDRKDNPTVEPKGDKDREKTINDDQYDKVKKGDPSVKDEVETNTGDGSDSSGNNPKTEKQADPRHKDSRRKRAGQDNFEEEAGDSEDSDFTDGGDSGSDKPAGKESRRRRQAGEHELPGAGEFPAGGMPTSVVNPLTGESGGAGPFNYGEGGDIHWGSRRYAEDRDAPVQNLQEGREHSDALLIPDAVNDPSNPETGGVQRDFTPGGDTGSDAPHREAMQLVADLYTDWAQGNNLRVASMNTLDVYAANGLHDDDYYLLASLIRRAECDCDDDKDDSDGGDSGGESSSSDDSDSDSSSDGGDDSDSDDSDSGADESDSDDGSSDNPFAGGDDSDDAGEPADDGGDPFGGADDSAPAGPEDSGDQVPPDDGGAPDDFGGEDPSAAGPPDVGGDPAGPPDAAGQEFTVPEQAPELPPEAMDQIPPDDTGGTQAVPPEVIDQILGLPPGTLEQLIAEELQGGGGAPPSGPAPGGPPPQLAFRRRAAEDPTQAAGADPAAAAQPQMPAAPPAGAGSAGTMPPPGSASVTPPPPAMPLENQPAEDALLDTALQAVTQMVDQETQEYQQVIDPLTQALQAIQFAQQVEQAENPLDVTPPEGSVDVDPSAAPGGADSLEKGAALYKRMGRRVAQIADRYKLTDKGKNMLFEAMSRKHYEHVGEAIRTLPPELRPGIANHIGAMFREDNPRFNNDKWLESVGAPRTASRRPFVIRSRTTNGGRTAGENLKNTPTLDAFEFPGQGAQAAKPEISDNNKLTDLPKLKGGAAVREAKDVLKKWDDYTTEQTNKGLNVGGDAEIDQFATEKQIGPKAIQKLKTTIGHNRKQASFFTRRVPGWKWDDHLAGYTSKEARAFTCSCGESIPTPSFGTCRCGKIWNSYAIGDSNHLASNSADMFIVREIPVRDDVIVANQQMQGSVRQACWPGCHEDKEHAAKFHDKDDEKTGAYHLAWDAAKVAGSNMIGEPVGHVSDPNFSGIVRGVNPMQGTAWVSHPGGIHEMSIYDLTSSEGTGPAGPSLKQRVRQHLLDRSNRSGPPGGFAGGRSAGREFFAESVTDESDGWIKYDDEDPSRQGGPKKPPSTTVKGGDPKWHTRGDQGKFKSTNPFGG